MAVYGSTPVTRTPAAATAAAAGRKPIVVATAAAMLVACAVLYTSSSTLNATVKIIAQQNMTDMMTFEELDAASEDFAKLSLEQELALGVQIETEQAHDVPDVEKESATLANSHKDLSEDADLVALGEAMGTTTPFEIDINLPHSEKTESKATCRNADRMRRRFGTGADGAKCAAGTYEFNQCASDGCDGSTQCPNVFGGTCISCKCTEPDQWHFATTEPTFANIADARNRAVDGNEVHILGPQSEGGCEGGVAEVPPQTEAGGYGYSDNLETVEDRTGPVYFPFSGQQSPRKCTGNIRHIISKKGTRYINAGRSVVAKGTNSCGEANSCVGGVVTSKIEQAEEGQHAEFTYRAIGGNDWYEAVVVLYKSADGETRNLDTDEIVGVKSVRGDKISRRKCPTDNNHHDCTGALVPYECDALGFIKDYLRFKSSGKFYLAFYMGSYDRTGGSVLGARMEIKHFKKLSASCGAECNQGADAAGECTEVTCDEGQTDEDGLASNGCEFPPAGANKNPGLLLQVWDDLHGRKNEWHNKFGRLSHKQNDTFTHEEKYNRTKDTSDFNLGLSGGAMTPVVTQTNVASAEAAIPDGSGTRRQLVTLDGSIADGSGDTKTSDNSPTSTTLIVDRFEAPVDSVHDGAERVHGFFSPPVTGEYTFKLAADDAGRLYINPDGEEGAAAHVIAEVGNFLGRPGFQNGDSSPDSTREYMSVRGESREIKATSAPIMLTAGTKCFISAIEINRQGRDALSVAAVFPNMAGGAPPADQPIPVQFGDFTLLEYELPEGMDVPAAASQNRGPIPAATGGAGSAACPETGCTDQWYLDHAGGTTTTTSTTTTTEAPPRATTEAGCKLAATREGLAAGGGGFFFSSTATSYVAGCYYYPTDGDSKYAGTAFFGDRGSDDDKAGPTGDSKKMRLN